MRIIFIVLLYVIRLMNVSVDQKMALSDSGVRVITNLTVFNIHLHLSFFIKLYYQKAMEFIQLPLSDLIPELSIIFSKIFIEM